MLGGLPAQAEKAGLVFKYYAFSDGNSAVDLNLRATQGNQIGWIGFYRDRQGVEQGRAGFDPHKD
ncbi:MAG TPA: hypothetical protein PLD79_07950, partial [Halothiobacillus sp.]|nr:hypothetical protein [Halothiobacillus sp.]